MPAYGRKRINLFLQTSQQEQCQQMPLHGILNYFLIVGKLCLLSCTRYLTLPNISGFKANIVLQSETDKNTSTCTYSKMKIFFKAKWTISPLHLIDSN